MTTINSMSYKVAKGSGAYGVVADGSSKKAPLISKLFRGEQDEDAAPCRCSEMQIKSILAGDESAVCRKCQKKLEEMFGGGRTVQSNHSQSV